MLVEEDDVQQLPMARISTRSQCCWAGSIHQHSTPCEVTAGRRGKEVEGAKSRFLYVGITQGLVLALICEKACTDRWPGGISDRPTPH